MTDTPTDRDRNGTKVDTDNGSSKRQELTDRQSEQIDRHRECKTGNRNRETETERPIQRGKLELEWGQRKNDECVIVLWPQQ